MQCPEIPCLIAPALAASDDVMAVQRPARYLAPLTDSARLIEHFLSNRGGDDVDPSLERLRGTLLWSGFGDGADGGVEVHRRCPKEGFCVIGGTSLRRS
jgi:hypothetical protein